METPHVQENPPRPSKLDTAILAALLAAGYATEAAIFRLVGPENVRAAAQARGEYVPPIAHQPEK